jgi:hypothetical protein
MLAHTCDHALRTKILRPRFSVLGRTVIADLFQHLELGKETTALELNRKNDIFVWIECPRSPSFQKLVFGRPKRDWRSCVGFDFACCGLFVDVTHTADC